MGRTDTIEFDSEIYFYDAFREYNSDNLKLSE